MNTTNIFELVQFVSSATEGTFGIGVLIAIFSIVTLTLIVGYPAPKAIAAGSFVTAVMATMFYILGAIDETTLAITIAIAGISLIGVVYSSVSFTQ